MVAARASGTGLSPADLERIRDTLASGRKPKVSFTESAGQIAGQIGQVVALTDPQLSDEWLVVRFGRDELPFSPTDLSIAPRQAPGRRAGASAPPPREEPSLPQQAPAPAEPAKPAPGRPAASTPPAPAAPATRPAAEDRPPAGSSTPAPRAPAAATNSAPAPGRPPTPESAASRPAEPKGPARKAAKPKPAPTLTVTLAYADGEWLVSATQGSKILAKPYVVRPSEALKMVSMLDVSGVHEAVEEIVSAARAEAETRAERLRAELAEVEARLAELRDQP